MPKLRAVVLYSFLTVVGSVLASFVLALIAYSRSGAGNVLGNASFCALTGGFSGAPLDGSWQFVILVPCAAYWLAGWVFLVAFVMFIISRSAQIVIGLFRGRAKVDSARRIT